MAAWRLLLAVALGEAGVFLPFYGALARPLQFAGLYFIAGWLLMLFGLLMAQSDGQHRNRGAEPDTLGNSDSENTK